MATITEAPPEPSHDELAALIEEARRRARRRRLFVAAAVVGVLLLAGLVTGLVLALRGGTGTAVPKGFHLVRARGPVRHALLHDFGPAGTTIALTGRSARPVELTREIWWNPGTGLSRTVYRYDGLAFADSVQQNCFTRHPLFCGAPSPFDLRLHGLGWPPAKRSARVVGSGSFHGHPIVWIEGLVQPPGKKPYPSGDQVGYDAVTHAPLVLRTIARSGPARIGGKPFRGHVFNGSSVTLLPTLPAKDVSFVVPKGGAPRNAGLKEASFQTTTLDRAREVLGHTPLWLGPSYHGHRLRFIQSGLSGSPNAQNRGVGMVPDVRLDYGPFRIDEFGDQRPSWSFRGPPPGTVFQSNGALMYSRDGVLVTVLGTFGQSHHAALELVRSLRSAG
jgi:hypothetical protein